jgi:hypothetical protein
MEKVEFRVGPDVFTAGRPTKKSILAEGRPMDLSLSKRESSEQEELYSSWSLFIVCLLLILSLLTSYYLQIKRIRAIHETVVSIFAGMVVGLVVRLAPGHLIREMLVRNCPLRPRSPIWARMNGHG